MLLYSDMYSMYVGFEMTFGINIIIIIIIRRGIRSSCYSEGSSEGSASSPCWFPGPSDPEPACGSDAPRKEMHQWMKVNIKGENTWKLMNVDLVC